MLTQGELQAIKAKTRAKGDTHGMSKLTKAKTLEIEELYRTGEFTQKQLGEQFGVSGATIGRVLSGKLWKD